MGYNGIEELPTAIRRLPVNAQHIYQIVFNKVWDGYRDPEDNEEGSRLETAHKIAWSAVKRKYRMIGNSKWTRKSGGFYDNINS